MHLTPETLPLRMKMTITGNKKSTVCSKRVSEGVAPLSWTIQSLNVALSDKSIGIIEKKVKTDLSDPFWLYVSFLQDYDADENGGLEIECLLKRINLSQVLFVMFYTNDKT